ncbi:hypothetical protein HZC07_02490 [Candidatus Micrarchaeota archaeon]|nr:hypothetical protein [Candidatus Micrarchaeota archaeon]
MKFLNKVFSKRMGKQKGQIWSVDLISGLFILTIVLLIFILIWNSLSYRWNSTNDYRLMETAGIFASESLMATPGDPPSWEMLPQIDNSNISAFGIVNGRAELNNMKLQKMVDENATAYDQIKQRVGLGKYELGIRITNLGKNTTYYEFGKFTGGLNTTANFDRVGLINQTIPVVVHIEVWK